MSEVKHVKLKSIFAFKEGMSTYFDDKGAAVPVTILRYSPWYVSQIKDLANDGYEAVQICCDLKKEKNSKKSELGISKKFGFNSGFRYFKEVRLAASSDVSLGDVVSIESIEKGDLVKVTAKSKGHGFSGSVRRWGFAGGPATHGSHFHRQPGSSGNRTWPGRVMPGKKFPGHWGNETVTVKNLKVLDVLPEENVVVLKGSVPGARNSIVRLVKV